MTGFQGLDPVVMRGVAQELRAQADHLHGVVSTVQGSVDEALELWDGDDAHQFSSWWISHYRPGLVAAQQLLVEMVATIERNVAEQERASGVRGALGSGAATIRAGNLPDFIDSADGHGTLPPGWQPITAAELKALGLDESDFTSNGMKAQLATDHHGHYVLSFVGTQDKPDILQDVTSALGPVGALTQSQLRDSVDLAKHIADRVGSENLTLTGHSLGGREAAVASLATGSRAVTFNAAGATEEDILYAQTVAGHPNVAGYLLGGISHGLTTDMTLDQGNITNYATTDDPVTYAQSVGQFSSFSIRPALGQTIRVPHLDPLHGHDLESFRGRL